MKIYKHILLFLSFFILMVNTVKVEANDVNVEEEVTVKITSYFSHDNQITTFIDDYDYGNSLSLDDKVITQTGYKFVFWIVNGFVKRGMGLSSEFLITKDMEIIAIFKEESKNVVLFTDANGKVLDIQYVNHNSNAIEPNIEYPTKPGYKISSKKWTRSLENITEDVIISLVYEKENDNYYEVVVENGVIVGSDNSSSALLKYNSIATVEAKETFNGKYFSHWQINDNIVSFNLIYSFTVLDDILVKAVYLDTKKTPTPIVSLSSELSLREGYKSFVGSFNLPSGCTLIEYGMLTSSNDEILTLNSPGVKKHQGSSLLTCTNEWLMSFNYSSTVSVRAFLVCKDLDGNILVFYNQKYVENDDEKEIINVEVYFERTVFYVNDEINIGNSYLTIYYIDGSISYLDIDLSMVSNLSTAISGDYVCLVNYLGNTYEVSYSVLKREPDYDVPSFEIHFKENITLSSISLPLGFTWNNPNEIVLEGINEYYATYTPTDTNEFEVITDIKIPVKGIDSRNVIIYEIYGGGGNSGAIYKYDYVILYNKANYDIDLSEYSIQYATSSSNSFSSCLKLKGLIKANNYYIIKLASNNNVGSNLPVNPHIEGTINANATSAKFALCYSVTQLDSVTNPYVIELVSYSGSNTTSYKRNLVTGMFEVKTPNLSYLLDNLHIERISVSNFRSIYELYEEISLVNAKLVLHYSNGTSTEIDLEYSMISGFDSSSIGEKELVITYNGFTTTFIYSIFDVNEIESVYVYYIDIGATGGKAGEASLIKIGNIEILIDTGNNDSNTKESLLAFLDSIIVDGIIEYVIASHPDADHIGNMVDVFDAYIVSNVIQYSTTSSPSNLRIEYEDAIIREGSTVYYIADLVSGSSTSISIIPGVYLTFYNTSFLRSNSNNASSIVFTLNAFDTRVLFNGDAETPQEKVYAPLVGDVDIFKLGHHGTSSATSTTLLEYIKPEVAIISNGDYLGNSYGHPTYIALKNIYSYSSLIKVYAVTGGNGGGQNRMHQRNGTITVEITKDEYIITSEYYGSNPIEIRQTDYWKNPNNPYRNSYVNTFTNNSLVVYVIDFNFNLDIKSIDNRNSFMIV